MAKPLGYTRTSTIGAYFRDRPGYFPEPDENADAPLWRRGTIVARAGNRPGESRRSSAPTAALPHCPPVPVDRDPDELLGTTEAAAAQPAGSGPPTKSSTSFRTC